MDELQRPQVIDYSDIQEYAQDMERYCDYLEIVIEKMKGE